MPHDTFFYLVVAGAVSLMGLAKGGLIGLGMLSMPLMAMVVPPVEAAAILLPVLIVQDLTGIWAFHRTWDKRILAIMLPSGVIGIVLGYEFASKVPEKAVTGALGLISMIFAARQLYLWLKSSASSAPKPSNPMMGMLCGTFSGFTSQIAHAGGPPFQFWVMPQGLNRETFLGTSIFYFAVLNWIKVPAYVALGQFTTRDLLVSATMVPLAAVSTAIGVRIARSLPENRFYIIVYGLLMALGADLIHRALI